MQWLSLARFGFWFRSTLVTSSVLGGPFSCCLTVRGHFFFLACRSKAENAADRQARHREEETSAVSDFSHSDSFFKSVLVNMTALNQTLFQSNIYDRQTDAFVRHESSCGAWPFHLKDREKGNQENALYIPMNTLLEALHIEAKRCSSGSSSTAPKSVSAQPVQFIKSQLIKKKNPV